MKSCPICAKVASTRFKNVNGFDVFKCSACELIWVPDVTQEQIKKFYSMEYFKSPNDLGYHDYVGDQKTLRINARYILANIPAPRSRDSKLLDVGCAFGFLMDEARKRGWNPYGVELNREATDYARDSLKLNVFHGEIFQSGFSPGTFESALIIGSIEHFANPAKIIQKTFELLEPGGTLALTTINTKGLVRLYDLKPPEHLHYFSDRNLSMLLESNGFKILKCLPYWCHYHLNEALCRAFRLLFRTDTRIEDFLSHVPFSQISVKVPTNEMFILCRKTDENP